jgi:hypothetical protein
MKMIKILASVVCLLCAAQILTGCFPQNTLENSSGWYAFDLRRPYNLEIIPGDGQVTLSWTSTNSADDYYPASAFSIYMAAGDFSDSECAGPINKYQLVESYADEDLGPVCGDLGPLFSQNEQLIGDYAILPVLLDDISNYTVPGKVSRVIVNGEPMTDFVDLEEELDDDDDAAATVYPFQSSITVDSIEPPATPAVAPGEIELANGTTYTFFVTTRSSDDYSEETYTSNWVAVSPRPGISDLSMTIGDCYDLDSLSTEFDCTEASDFEVVLITDPARLIQINGINGAQLVDAGAVDSFHDIDKADNVDNGGFLPSGAGVIVLPEHVYVVYTNSGYYGKVFVSEMTHMVDLYEEDGRTCSACLVTEYTTLTIQAALQTNGRLLKK